MDDEEIETKEDISRMFVENKELFSSDEELALHIMHRFNIDMETIESMPAFDKPLKSLFLEEKDR